MKKKINVRQLFNLCRPNINNQKYFKKGDKYD